MEENDICALGVNTLSTLRSFEMTLVSGDSPIIYMSMTYASRDKKISSWPEAGVEFLILVIILMTFFPVVGSKSSAGKKEEKKKRALLYLLESHQSD